MAILPRTYPGSVDQYIKAADHVLIFAGELGKNGGTADLLQVEKVKIIRKINPDVEIGWDGGVSMDNVRTLAHSDINILNAGSALRTEDPKTAWEALMKEREARGVKI